ncbi:uncharacterized protein LOC108101643 [Drosophila ficusphila]|uniref:uncharacterized protein LOC108101643 n=1 Tax=Drosophila ficusphila TaxID=30025 RepID=UPI0007E7F619|nr:uncharacterized protein LOC108101643 [Drosophila ficusphila]
MQLNDHWRKIVKTLIFAFLCTEMQTTYTHRVLAAKRAVGLTGVGAIATAPGDDRTRPQMAPYQASIRLLAEERDYFGKGHICSGALVAPSVVLTVGSCVFSHAKRSAYHPSQLRVMLGNPQRFAPRRQALMLGVTHIHQPPKDLTIAILMLEKNVPADHPLIQPIGLPSLDVSSGLYSKSENVFLVSTWGYDGDISELHDLVTLNVTRTTCDQQPNKPPKICVRAESSSSTPDRIYMDTGATLAGLNCLIGLQSIDGRFEDVAIHVQWIEAKIGDGGHQNSSIWGILAFLAFTGYVITISRKSFLP